ncbi:MAG TPA: LPS export ABC transporter ATP-binding protein [Gemmatimonadaceae bacterium]|nr:LPS export ABC transporter ATP-binding protein [Gemmatimonadaceae bacterium]
MTGPRQLPEGIRALITGVSDNNSLDGFALDAIVRAADANGVARLRDVAAYYREDHLRALRARGQDANREAGRLAQDEVRSYLANSTLPRLAEKGILAPLGPDTESDAATVSIAPNLWREIAPNRERFAEVMRETGEHSRLALATPAKVPVISGSLLEAEGLTKTYRGRKVVNNVALNLRQGEIVGLLGPNGAGKTTTFYMIVGLIQPQAGRILLDGGDITNLPMYQRARKGIGYLSQEPSIFRKLSVEDNILAILETLPLSAAERSERLERLLDELTIKRLRKSKAYALSGGERRRLEITRALVTDPKFMMLDEPFAGVDPIAVHDIQTIVAGLRHRGIGVLISDHNVEQTLDIVDRAYIMFDGQVKVSGTVRDLVFDDTVADIYLGPTLTARLRDRFSRTREEVAIS